MYATTGLPTFARDIITLIARITLGAIFIAHGWQKFNEWTIAGTSDSFAQMGVPLADIAAPVATFIELIGGALLILGALTPIVGFLLAANVIGALIIVHLVPTPFVDQGGWELVSPRRRRTADYRRGPRSPERRPIPLCRQGKQAE